MRSLFFFSVSFICWSLVITRSTENKYKPVVMFHGLGDTAYGSINSLIKLIREELNDSIYVTSLQMQNGSVLDFIGSYFANVNENLARMCETLENDQQLKNGFTIIGFSQGGQFARALVQRCNVTVLNLITFGAQHQGIYGIPKCKSENHSICIITDKLFQIGFYNSLVQSRFVPAQYWHDINYSNYVKHSQFIADVNNELVQNDIYKKRLMALKRFVMVKFTEDTIVDPIESSHFGFFADYDADKIVKLEQSLLYKQDKLGLKTLDETKRLIRIALPGDHLQFKKEWFKKEIINQYISNETNY